MSDRRDYKDLPLDYLKELELVIQPITPEVPKEDPGQKAWEHAYGEGDLEVKWNILPPRGKC